MRILGTVFFPKFFGGKIKNFWKDISWRMRIFLSFLAGNLKILNRILPWIFFHLNNQQCFNQSQTW